MESELVSGSLSESWGEPVKSSAPISYTAQFYECLPSYLAMGMSYDEFWNADCERAIYYRKAQKIKNQQFNEKCWLQGMYVYEAVCDAHPLFRENAKSGTKPIPYPNKPYEIFEDDEKAKENEEKEKMEFQKQRFMNLASAINASMDTTDKVVTEDADK